MKGLLIAMLLLANGLLFSWHQGGFANVSWVPKPDQREPERMRREIAPERVQVLTPKLNPEPSVSGPAN